MYSYRPTGTRSSSQTSPIQNAGARIPSTPTRAFGVTQGGSQSVSSISASLPSASAPIVNTTPWAPPTQATAFSSAYPVNQAWMSGIGTASYGNLFVPTSTESSYSTYNSIVAPAGATASSMSFTEQATILGDVAFSSYPAWTPMSTAELMGNSTTVLSAACPNCNCSRTEQYSVEEVPHSPLYSPLGQQNAVLANSSPPAQISNPTTPGPGGRDNKDKATTSVSCAHCKQIFTGPWATRNRNRHQEQCDDKKTFQCKACDKTYNRTDARLVHERKDHPELKHPPPNKRKKMEEN